jgi:hypothetical protein
VNNEAYQMKRKTTAHLAPIPAADPHDALIPDPAVWIEFNVSSMTGYRWDHDPAMAALGWPPPIRIRSKKYRSRKQLENFKANMLAQALTQRSSAR